VERIRQKNLEDNQLFLEKLLMTNVKKSLFTNSELLPLFLKIRNDFVNSARSIIRKDGNNPAKTYYRQYEKYLLPTVNLQKIIFLLELNVQLDITKK
jgi:hypothetical protein